MSESQSWILRKSYISINTVYLKAFNIKSLSQTVSTVYLINGNYYNVDYCKNIDNNINNNFIGNSYIIFTKKL